MQSKICEREGLGRLWGFAVALGATLLLPLEAQGATDEAAQGKALLERNCGRCHALAAEASSPLAAAPNLWIVLSSYPAERLEFELAEGIGSRHRDMPQVQFTAEDIGHIESYLRSGDDSR
jgi:mono/diheme cytochrome c family protein